MLICLLITTGYSDAEETLMMFNEANLQTLFMRMRCKGTKKIWIFSMLRASGGEKTWNLRFIRNMEWRIIVYYPDILKINKNKDIFVIGFVKTEILVQLCHNNDRKHQTTCQIHSAWYKKPCQRWHEMCRKGLVAWRLYNSLSEDGRNSVSCITPYGMVQETLFLRPGPKERVRKQRVWMNPWELLSETT